MAQGEQCGSLEPCTYVDGYSVRSHILQKQLFFAYFESNINDSHSYTF